MNGFKMIDAFGLNMYQEFAHWFQKVFGPTNFSLVRASLLGLCVINLFALAMPVVILQDFRIGSIILLMAVGMILFFGFYINQRSEKNYYKTGGNLRNKNEKIFFKWRIYCVIFFSFRAIVFIQDIVDDFSITRVLICGLLLLHNILIVNFFYFVSCTPLPPCDSKAKKQWGLLKRKISKIITPQPNIVPAR
jgi:hypothetical protein